MNEDFELLLCERLLEYNSNENYSSVELGDFQLFIHQHSNYINASVIFVAFHTCPQPIIQMLLSYIPKDEYCLYVSQALESPEIHAIAALSGQGLIIKQEHIIQAIIHQRISHAIYLITQAVLSNHLDCSFVYMYLFGYFYNPDCSSQMLQTLCVLQILPSQDFLLLCVKNQELKWLQMIFKHFSSFPALHITFLYLISNSDYDESYDLFLQMLASSIPSLSYFVSETIEASSAYRLQINHRFAVYFYERYESLCERSLSSYLFYPFTYPLKKFNEVSRRIIGYLCSQAVKCIQYWF